MVLMLFLFFPVGLVLLWTSPQTKLVGRLVWTIVIGLMVLIAASPSDPSTAKPSTRQSTASQSAPNAAQPAATKPATSQPAPTQPKTVPADEFNFTVSNKDDGQVFKGKVVSDVGFAVIGAEKAATLGNSFVTEKAGNGAMFVVIQVYVKNNQKDAITLDGSLFKLLADGREYSYSIEGSTAMEMSQEADSLFLKQLNPGISIQGKIPFEVPADLNMEKAQLQVRGGMTGRAATLPALPELQK